MVRLSLQLWDRMLSYCSSCSSKTPVMSPSPACWTGPAGTEPGPGGYVGFLASRSPSCTPAPGQLGFPSVEALLPGAGNRSSHASFSHRTAGSTGELGPDHLRDRASGLRTVDGQLEKTSTPRATEDVERVHDQGPY
jgi:hypothetical protein